VSRCGEQKACPEEGGKGRSGGSGNRQENTKPLQRLSESENEGGVLVGRDWGKVPRLVLAFGYERGGEPVRQGGRLVKTPEQKERRENHHDETGRNPSNQRGKPLFDKPKNRMAEWLKKSPRDSEVIGQLLQI